LRGAGKTTERCQCKAALRGDVPAAQAVLVGLDELRATEDPQDPAIVALVEAFTAAARRQPAAALDRARAAVDYVGALGISSEQALWAWPLAARAAWDLANTEASAGLLGCRPLLDRAASLAPATAPVAD
jgi:hypothetical protein